MKQLVLGQNAKEDVVIYNTGGVPYIIGDCILCDKPVWCSPTAYTTDEPTKEHVIPKAAKPLHKDCVLELFALGADLVKAIEAQIAYKKKN